MKMKRFLILIISLLLFGTAFSQELKCRVSLTSKDQQGSDKDYCDNLRKSIEQFMNSQAWTDNLFDEKEKIEVNLSINVTQKTGDAITATLQIQSNRPIYNSRYSSIMLNMVDNKLNFNYQEFQTIEIQDQNFNSNLTYVLGFYTYILLGIDYDSF